MCHSEADQELWESDPHEYISQKFGIFLVYFFILFTFIILNYFQHSNNKLNLLDIFEDLISPVMAAQSTLHSACKKRKDILPKAVQFIVGVITSNDATPSQKDGALHMVNIKHSMFTLCRNNLL